MLFLLKIVAGLLVACNAALVLAFLGAGWTLAVCVGIVFGMYTIIRF